MYVSWCRCWLSERLMYVQVNHYVHSALFIICRMTIQVVLPFFRSCRIFVDNSEVIKAVYLAFVSIKWHFIRHTDVRFHNSNLFQSQDIGQNSDGRIFNFWFSGQSLENKNCLNSITIYISHIKLLVLSKLDKKSTITSANPDITVIFSIYAQFGWNRKMDFGCMVHNS